MKLKGHAQPGNDAVLVLGIDPGIAITGYGLLKMENGRYSALDYGCLRTPAGQKLPQRLLAVFQGICTIIDQYKPGIMAVEQLFFCKNIRTATQVGESRGAILTAAAVHNIPIAEYTPLQVKQAVAGYGRAEKKQVQQMVTMILKLAKPPTPDDAADALAVALCHLHSKRWHEAIGKLDG